MLNSELEKMYLKTDKGVVTPKYTFENVIDVFDEQGIRVDKEYVGLVITKTAEEVYDGWVNREQIDTCSKPTIEEQLLATQKMLLSLQEQIIDMA